MCCVDPDHQRKCQYVPAYDCMHFNLLKLFVQNSYVQLKNVYTPGDQRFEEHIRPGPMSDSSASERHNTGEGIEQGNEETNGGRVETVERTS